MSREADIPVNQIICGDWIEVAEGLPAGFVHTIITSPPYWGQRNYSVDGQLGLEETPEEHIEKLVMGFRELRRILRDDGILWLNYGDKYTANNTTTGGYSDKSTLAGYSSENTKGRRMSKSEKSQQIESGLSQGNLIGLAWRLALALQADGWILRSDVIWAKAISSFGQHVCPSCGKELYQCLEQGDDLFGDELPDEIVNHKKSGSTMPESVNGTRWERCRVKVRSVQHSKMDRKSAKHDNPTVAGLNTRQYGKDEAQYQDCPGCPKCEANDGLVLRRGSWRPTRAHEYLFQFVKQVPYYADMEAVREEANTQPHASGYTEGDVYAVGPMNRGGHSQREDPERIWGISGRNLRDVWTINPQPYPKAHYATFPEKLVEPCIKVSTSQKGVCPKCGSQWARIIDRTEGQKPRASHEKYDGVNAGYATNPGVGRDTITSKTLGWKPICGCGCMETVPAVVYDPFTGSGTVPAVAARMGRNYCGSELKRDYLENQATIRISAAESGLSADEIESGQMAMFEAKE